MGDLGVSNLESRMWDVGCGMWDLGCFGVWVQWLIRGRGREGGEEREGRGAARVRMKHLTCNGRLVEGGVVC